MVSITSSCTLTAAFSSPSVRALTTPCTRISSCTTSSVVGVVGLPADVAVAAPTDALPDGPLPPAAAEAEAPAAPPERVSAVDAAAVVDADNFVAFAAAAALESDEAEGAAAAAAVAAA